jgi:hypothetical protein
MTGTPRRPLRIAASPSQRSAEQQLETVSFRVMRPEYLCGLWLQAGGAKWRERVEVLRQSGIVAESALQRLLAKHVVSR